jgi:hypothetical protein
LTRTWREGGAVEGYIAAAPDAVYARIADVTNTGERSVECRSCEWLAGATPGSVGARFRGRNRSGIVRWSRTCEVVDAEPDRAFAFRTVPERFDPSRADSTTWSYLLVPEGAGTRVTHSYRITTWPVGPFKWLFGLLYPQHRDMRPQMSQTLEALRVQLDGVTRTSDESA